MLTSVLVCCLYGIPNRNLGRIKAQVAFSQICGIPEIGIAFRHRKGATAYRGIVVGGDEQFATPRLHHLTEECGIGNESLWLEIVVGFEQMDKIGKFFLRPHLVCLHAFRYSPINAPQQLCRYSVLRRLAVQRVVYVQPVDGKKAEVKRANTMSMGLELTEGSHKIRFEYQTPGLKTGALATCSGLGVFAVLIILLEIYYRNKSRKSRTIKN